MSRQERPIRPAGSSPEPLVFDASWRHFDDIPQLCYGARNISPLYGKETEKKNDRAALGKYCAHVFKRVFDEIRADATESSYEGMIPVVLQTVEEQYSGMYVGSDISVARAVGSCLLAASVLTSREATEADVSRDEAFIKNIERTARASSQIGHSYFGGLLRAVEVTGELWGAPVTIPEDKGYYNRHYTVADNYFSSSRERMENVSDHPEIIAFLSSVPLFQENKSIRFSYWDLFKMAYGLRPYAKPHTSNEIYTALPFMQQFNKARIFSVLSFVQKLLDGEVSEFTIQPDGTAHAPTSLFSEGLFPVEVRMQLRNMNIQREIEKRNALMKNGWEKNYRNMGILEWEKMILETVLEVVSAYPVPGKLYEKEFRELVHQQVIDMLRKKYPEGKPSIAALTLHQKVQQLSQTTGSETLLYGRTGASSATRITLPEDREGEVAGFPKDIGLLAEDAISAIELLLAEESGDFNRWSLKGNPFFKFLTYWHMRSNVSWEQLAPRFGFTTLSPFTYAAKAALAETVLTQEGRDVILQLRQQFVFREPQFFSRIEKWVDGGERSNIAQAVRLALLLEGTGRFTRAVTKATICHAATKDAPLRFLHYVVRETAQQKPAPVIVRELGIDEDDNQKASLVVTQMNLILFHYPVEWVDIDWGNEG